MARLKNSLGSLKKVQSDLSICNQVFTSSDASICHTPTSFSSIRSSRHISNPPDDLEADKDKLIKTLLKLFKKLEIALGKFNSKQNGIAKTNILRTLLLPFLRQPSLRSSFTKSSQIYLSFTSISTSILGLWWRLLLSSLNASGPHQVSATDRNAYLECISRILALEEWDHADTLGKATYVDCLTDTLDFAIGKILSYKVVSISLCAFVGKVFAHSFFKLPGVCNALLFLLNIKQSTFSKHIASLPPILTATKLEIKGSLPPASLHLINYRGVRNLEKAKSAAINCMVPPKHAVKGIKDPSGPWVRLWNAKDSDVFNSFFRHYINLAACFLEGNSNVDPLALPGFTVITCYIHNIFSESIHRIAIDNTKPNAFATSSMKFSPGPTQTQERNRASSGVSAPSNYSFKPNNADYTSIIKIFKSIRDVAFYQISFASSLIKIIDGMLVNIAKLVSPFDVNKSSLLLNLVYEFSAHIFDYTSIDWEFWLGCVHTMLTTTHHVQIITRNFAFLFNVWTKIPVLLTKEDLPQSVDYLKGWLTESNESLKVNFMNWLTCNRTWLVFFTHWNPLVRAYYSRLIVWRILGVNNYQDSHSFQTTRRVKLKLARIHESLHKMMVNEKCKRLLEKLDFSADAPMVNRKFGIVPINSKFSHVDEIASFMSLTTISKLSDLRKTHPYEIFDEAIYTCTSLPNAPDSQKGQFSCGEDVPINHSLISSLGKFFKLLSVSDAPKEIAVAPPRMTREREEKSSSLRKGFPGSKSSTSLSSIPSMRSRSSSPSLASFRSSVNSLTENSGASSMTSDSDSSSLLSDCLGTSASPMQWRQSSQPPELVKIPPEVVRPIFKLDIVLDHERASKQYSRMQNTNNSRCGRKFYQAPPARTLAYLTLPTTPEIPSVSIFLNSESYKKFSITKEDFEMGDDAMSKDDLLDLEQFSKQLARMTATAPLNWVSMGRSLNEWNATVREFEKFLFEKVEADQANFFPMSDSDALPGEVSEIDEDEYLMRIIPFLPIDNFTELKLLNAS